MLQFWIHCHIDNIYETEWDPQWEKWDREKVPGIDQHLTDLEKKDKIVMMIFLW